MADLEELSSERRTDAPFAVLLVAATASGYISPLVGPYTLQLGSLTLYALDIGCLVALMLMAHERQLRLPRPMSLLFVSLVFCTVWGLATYPTQEALNSVRTWWWFAVAIVVGACCKPSSRLVVFALAAVEVVTLYGLAKQGIHGAADLRQVNGEFVTLRPLTETGALLVLMLGIMLVAEELESRRVRASLLGLAAILLVVAEQRTVWVAGAAVAPVLALRWIRRTHLRNPQAGYAAVGIAALAMPVVVWLLTQSRSIVGSAQSQGTLRWRFESWRSVLNLMHGKAWLIGHPAGVSPLRFVGGILTDVEAHNLYVGVIYRLGLVGFVGLAMLGVAAWRRTRLRSEKIASALLIAAFVSGLTYGPTIVVGLAIGILLPVAQGERVRHARQTTPFPYPGGSIRREAPAS